MTTVVYNGIVLRDCETKSFEQEIRYDGSDTDVLYSRFTIRVASTVVAIRNVSGERQFGVDTQHGNTAIERQHDIQQRLSEARKDFWMLVDQCVPSDSSAPGDPLDQPLLIAAGKAYDEVITGQGTPQEQVVRTPLYMSPHPFSDDSDTRLYGAGTEEIAKASVLDCENGPKPSRVSVTKIIGGRSLRVEFEIVVCRKICSEDFVDSEPVAYGDVFAPDERILSNRWHLEETKDENWITTRSLQGTLRVTHSDHWPHAMRYLCVPGLLNGYKRIHQSFVSDPTGLTLKYRIDDRQVHAAAPYPAVSWSGHHAATSSGANGVVKGAQVDVRLTGPPGVNKQQLIGAAVKVAANKIPGLIPERDENGDFDYKVIIKNASVVDVMDQPTIELRVQVQYTDEYLDFQAFFERMESMGDYLPSDGPYAIDGYNPRVNPVPLAYDSSTPAGVFNCYLQHPCSIWHGMPGGQYPGGNLFDNNDDSESVDEIERPSNETSGDPDAVVFEVDHELPTEASDLSASELIYRYPYTYVEMSSRYEITEGWSALPLATTAANATRNAMLVQLHGPVAVRILTMTATRNGRPATIPAMTKELTDHNGNREVLAKRTIQANVPKLLANGGGREYSTEIQFVYLLEKTPPDDGKLRIGSSPLDAFSPDNNWLDLGEVADTEGRLQYDENTVTYPA